MELEKCASPGLENRGFEVYLLRTLPNLGKYTNLKMKVCRIAKRWEIPQPGIYPVSCRIPQSVFCLDEQPPADSSKTQMLVVNFDQIPSTRFLGGQSKQYYANLSLDWTVSFVKQSFLGKKPFEQGSHTPKLGTKHRVAWSHMGVKQTRPIINGCHDWLDTQAIEVYKLSLDISDQFRLRYDEITRMINIETFSDDGGILEAQGAYFCSKLCGKGPAKTAARSYHKDYAIYYPSEIDIMEPATLVLRDFDQPDMSVYFHLCDLVENKKAVPKYGLLDLLNQVIASAKIWADMNTAVTVVPRDIDLKEMMTPIEALVRWASPIHEFFFEPVAAYCKYGNLIKSPPCFEILNKVKQIPSYGWSQSLRYFRKVSGLRQILKDVYSTRNIAKLTSCWKIIDPEVVDFANFCFDSRSIMNVVSELLRDKDIGPLFIEHMSAKLIEFRISDWKRIQACQETKTIELSHSQVKRLFSITKDLVKVDPVSSSDTLSSRITQDWVCAKAVSGSSELRFTYDEASYCWSTCVVQAVCYQSMIILITIDHQDHGKIIEVSILEKHNKCRSHTFVREEKFFDLPPQDDHAFYAASDKRHGMWETMGHKYRFQVWSNGTLVWLRKREKSLIVLSCIDFRPCKPDPDAPPRLYDLVVTKEMVGIDGLTIRDDNDCWTVGFNTVSVLGFTSSELPILFAVMITQAGFSSPQRMNWASYLTAEECNRLTALDPSRQYMNHAKLIAAAHSKILFMMLLQPEAKACLPTDRNGKKDLWIFCLRWHSATNRYVVVTKLIHKVPINYFLYMTESDEQSHPLVAKIVHSRKQDILLLSVGKRDLEVFTLIRARLHQIRINSSTSTELPELPGQQIWLAGMLTNYFSAYSVVEYQDKRTGKPLLDIYGIRLRY